MNKINKYLKKLNRQESRFTEEYIKHGDRVIAWKKAYPKILVDPDKIHSLATALMKSAHIQAELKQYLTDSEIKYGLSKVMLIKELKSIAFFDIKEVLNEDGSFKTVKELHDAGKVISELLVSVETDEESGITTTSRKLKLANKLTAIDMLSKMMGYYAPEEHRMVDAEGNDVTPQLTVVFQKFGNPDVSHIQELPNSDSVTESDTVD